MSAPATPPTPATPSASTSPAVRVLAGGAAALPRGERVEVDTPAGVLVLTTPRRLNGRWEVARPGGAPALFQPGDPAQRARAAGAVGLGEADLFAAVAQAEAALRAPADEAVPAVFVITVASGAGEERREERVEAADPLAALDAALASGLPFLRWQGVERLVALDVDVRADGAGGRYADADAERALTRTGADAAWVTRSGGLRLMFVESPTMTALDRALAGLVLGELGGAVSPEKVEAKADTRRPPAGAIVFPGSLAPDEATALVVARAGGRDQPGDLPEAAIDAWLAERSMERGQRYEHDRCPIAPSPTSGNAPVMVGDEGVYCYRCQGVTGRGWRSWAALVERDGAEPEPDALVVAARSWVHVAHQRLVLARWWPVMIMPPRVGREATDVAAWRAILRAVHAGALADPERRPDAEARLAAAMSADLDLVRGETGWLNATTLAPAPPLDRPAAQAFPWTWRGREVRALREHKVMRSTDRLEGFMPVVPSWTLAGLRGEGANAICYAPRPMRRSPRGVPPADLRAAGRALLDGLPGFGDAHRRALSVILAGIVRAEVAPETPSMVVLYGPTRAGKGFLLALACGVVGAGRLPIKLDWQGGASKLIESIGTGLERGAPVLLLDEVGKMGREWFNESSALLQMSGSTDWRKLYAGHVTTRCRALVALAGSTLPRGLCGMSEMDERAVLLELPETPEAPTWEARLRELTGTSAQRLRDARGVLDGGEAVIDGAQAAEGALLELGATWPGDLTDWRRAALAIGARRLTDADEEGPGREALVRALYDAWRTGPDAWLVPTGASHAPGWLRLSPRTTGDEATSPAGRWGEVVGPLRDDDGRLPSGTLDAIIGRLETVRLAPVLGVPGLRLLVRRHGTKVAARFMIGQDKAGQPERRAFPPASPADSSRGP